MKKPCEQFGAERAVEIDQLVEAATGAPCAGRTGGRCPLAPPGGAGAAVERRLKVAI